MKKSDQQAKLVEKERRRLAATEKGSANGKNSNLDRLDESIAAKLRRNEKVQNELKETKEVTSENPLSDMEEILKSKREASNPRPSVPRELELLDSKIDAKVRQVDGPNAQRTNSDDAKGSLQALEAKVSSGSRTNESIMINRVSIPTGTRKADTVYDEEMGREQDYDDTTATEITATVVGEDVVEEEKRMAKVAEDRVRKEMQQNIVTAEIVDPEKSNGWKLICFGVLVLAIVAIVLGVTLSKSSQENVPVPEIVKYLQTASSEPDLRYPLPAESPTSTERALNWFGEQSDVLVPATEQDEILLLQAFVMTTLWFQSTKPNLDPIETIQNCQWTPMVCDDDTGEIVELYLSEFALEGTIPRDLGSMTKLSALNLQRNSLTGNLPSELGSLSMLTQLLLFDNVLQGTFPTEIGGLTNLQRLEFGGNQFSGPLPTELGQLTQLTLLDFRDNAFTGQVPTELVGLSEILDLSFASNAFSGTIPTEFAEMSSLLGLVIADTNVGGTIPSQLPPNLENLILVNNQLTGTIPTELGLLTSVEQILLYNNTLDSTIPMELGSLTALTRLALGQNRLRESLPSEVLTGLPILSTLELDDSGLSGPIGSVLGSWTNSLQVLDLSSNEFEGTIPTELATYTLLQELYLARNADITGSIPSELAALTDMDRFDVSSCPQLVGTVPPELVAWSDIAWALLHHTGLTGVFPWCESPDEDLFVADCSLVQCDCCHFCCSEEEDCVEFF